MSDPQTPAAQPPAFPRPLPRPEGDSRRYWEALREERIELPRCSSCRSLIFYPRSFCPSCLGSDVVWEKIDGAGRVYTFSIVRKPTNPWFFERAPYVYAIVELDAGVRLPTMIVGGKPEDVKTGARVRPVFERASDEITLLCFALADG